MSLLGLPAELSELLAQIPPCTIQLSPSTAAEKKARGDGGSPAALMWDHLHLQYLVLLQTGAILMDAYIHLARDTLAGGKVEGVDMQYALTPQEGGAALEGEHIHKRLCSQC